MKNTESTRAIKSALRQLNSVAYRQGQATGIQLLEWVVHLQNRADEYPANLRATYRADQAFINGALDVLETCLADTLSRPRNKAIEAMRQAIIDDFFDNARAALIQHRERVKDQAMPFPNSPIR